MGNNQYVRGHIRCPVCGGTTPIPATPVSNTGLLSCPQGHTFPYRRPRTLPTCGATNYLGRVNYGHCQGNH